MKQISIEIIHKCPNNCLHCSSYSGINCTMKIETEKVKDIIDSAVKLETEMLSISGGEPFLHEGLFDIVEYAKIKGIKVSVYTSGIIVDEFGNIENLSKNSLQKLYNIGVDKIIFDLPAIDEEVYDEFMGTKGYQKYAFKSIDDTRKMGIFTEIHFVPTKINFNQIDKMLEYVQKNDINQISFLGLVPHGRALENQPKLYLNKIDNSKLKNKLKQISTRNVRIGIPLQDLGSKYCCYAGKNKLCIRYDGKVFGCEAFKYIKLWNSEGKVIIPDTIYNSKLEDIYWNSEYLKAEQKFIAEQLKDINCQENCPVQRMIRKAANL